MQYYAEVSKHIQEILQRFTPIIEPLSLDEAFLDVRGSQALFGSAAVIGCRIKTEIRQELHLVASVGVAPVKFVAKIASDLQKPDGFVVVDAARVQEFLEAAAQAAGVTTSEWVREVLLRAAKRAKAS